MTLASVRSYLDEPAIADPPAPVGRDRALVVMVACVGVLEAALRTDASWLIAPAGWRLASLGIFLLVLPALLIRRTRPLLAMTWTFAPALVFSVVVAAAGYGSTTDLGTSVVVLVIPYAMYRWGSGRQTAIGAVILLTVAAVAIATDPLGTPGEWIGGTVVLFSTAALGLAVRYRATARDRTEAQIRGLEREQLARELHDTVAHHVSAIAVQAQAGLAVADSDPQAAKHVLGVIEEAAARTLDDMREIVGSLRRRGDGVAADAELRPQLGLSDLESLAESIPPNVRFNVEISDEVGTLSPLVDAALYRIAQEAVTNAVRHARRATSIVVRVTTATDVVRLEVTNDGDSGAVRSATPLDGQRFGLVGMAERADLLGGHLRAGPDGTSGWRVLVELPMLAEGRPVMNPLGMP